MKYQIDSTTLTSMANGVRHLTRENGNFTPEQMIAKLNASELGVPINLKCHINESGVWVRPQEYPDLDVLYNTIGDTESCVYMTYDLRKTEGYGWIGLYVAGGTWYAERGHIENNAFVADYTSSAVASGNYFRQNLDSSNGNVQLWRIRTTGDITRYCHVPNTTTNANNFSNNLQPCVERVGKLPYVTNFSSSIGTSSSNGCVGTVWLERDRLMVGSKSKLTNLGNMYHSCYSLQETHCDEWDTSGWAVTTISQMFYRCMFIKSLDLSGWDTSKWKVTGANNAIWQNCFSLRSLNVSTWDTSGWTVSNFNSNWDYCMSLEELDLNGWDVSKWTVSSIAYEWRHCESLKKLKVSSWDTSNWKVTSIYATWQYCSSLINFEPSQWDVSGWLVTTMAYAWSQCLSLRVLDLSEWDVSGWSVTSLYSTWCYCISLEILPISGWDVSNWCVTTLYETWANCRSIKLLNLNGWDVSSWVVTNLHELFSNCWSLVDIKVDKWDTSEWAVTDIAYLFASCWSLENIDLTSWDTSNWAVTTCYQIFAYTYSMKTIDVHTWDVSNWELTDARYLAQDSWVEILLIPSEMHGSVANAKWTQNLTGLVNFSGYSIDINQNYSNSLRLTRESLLSIISRLPTVTSQTLTLGQTNKLKLTAAEIAVATQKGWTVA